MREENPEQAHDSALQSSPASHGRQWCDLTKLLQSSPRLQAMASTVGNGPAPSKRDRASRGFNTRTALLFMLAASPVAMAQNCISLSGSKECPAFSSASISTDDTLVGFLYGSSQSMNCRLDC